MPAKKYSFNNDARTNHYIVTNETLDKKELETLAQLLLSFPHAANTSTWPEAFRALDLTHTPKKLLKLAANAYDQFGNTVLGVVAEYGNDLSALQKLVSMGADVNEPDHLHNKLPIHWAIDNKASSRNRDSVEAIAGLKFLVANGADLMLPRDRGDGSPPISTLQYAIGLKYTAAVSFLKIRILKPVSNSEEHASPRLYYRM